MVCGSEDIKQTIMDELGIHDGETTKDGLFTLLEVARVPNPDSTSDPQPQP